MRGWLSSFMATHGAIAAAVALMTLGAGGATAVARVNGRIERIEREHESIRARMLLLETATDTIRSTTQATRALADRILCYLEADRGRRPMADCIREAP